MSSPRLLGIALLVAAAATLSADHAYARQFLVIDKCLIYGFPPHSRAYAECRMNLRRFWTTGLAPAPSSPQFIANTVISIRRRSSR